MRSLSFLSLLLSLSLATELCAELCAEPSPASRVEVSLTDTEGKRRTQAEWKGKKAVVLLFLGAECPVSNGYAPEFERLASKYSKQGILVWGLHPDPDITAEIARKHAGEYRLSFPILLDPEQRVARSAGVEVTPEAVVLTPTGEILYRGRIDDRYSAGGKRRDEPTTRDLLNALEAVLAGKSPEVPYRKAHGCPLPAPRVPGK